MTAKVIAVALLIGGIMLAETCLRLPEQICTSRE
jgi:hypothetical protein